MRYAFLALILASCSIVREDPKIIEEAANLAVEAVVDLEKASSQEK